VAGAGAAMNVAAVATCRFADLIPDDVVHAL
jgi:hypothetical protein